MPHTSAAFLKIVLSKAFRLSRKILRKSPREKCQLIGNIVHFSSTAFYPTLQCKRQQLNIIKMKKINVPTREQVSPANQALFDTIKKNVGKIPNIWAAMAHSENGLATYFALTTAKSSLNAKEKEVINLVVSQVNNCDLCLAAHTTISKMNGITEEQTLEIRQGRASFNPKLEALAKYTKEASENFGHASKETVNNLFAAGYTPENVVDIILVIGDKIITNYLQAVAQVPIDFPAAPALKENV
jgi:AhpD family alkylhydroperoxidase